MGVENRAGCSFSLSLSHTHSLPFCTMLLVAALTVLLAGLVAEARVEVSETSMEHLQLYVLREKCWGEAAMAEYIAFQEKAMKKCGLLKGSVPVVQHLAALRYHPPPCQPLRDLGWPPQARHGQRR